MADSRKAGKLILDNLAMFNESVELFGQQIEPEVFKEVCNCVGSWAKENGWICIFDWNKNTESCWVAPASWKTDEEELDANVWFGFDFENANPSSLTLADLCGYRQDRIGFMWGDSLYLGMTKTQWKAFCRSVPAETSSKLSEIGFDQKTNGWFTGWFIAVTLDSAKLAMAYENEDYTEAMNPMIQVLEKLKSSQAIFDEILSLARDT